MHEKAFTSYFFRSWFVSLNPGEIENAKFTLDRVAFVGGTLCASKRSGCTSPSVCSFRFKVEMNLMASAREIRL